MAKYNVFKEASRRYKDMKARGFIPENSPLAYQDFVKEVSAENRGETYEGTYTASAYSDAYGVDVDYYEGENYHEVAEERLQQLVSKYKDDLMNNVFSINDFKDLSEKYSERIGFNASDVWGIQDLDELANFMRQAQRVDPFLFRNKNGRNRQTESGDMETYRSDYLESLNGLIQSISEEKMRFEF